MILLLTIPHTGTHFMRDHLLRELKPDVLCRHMWSHEREGWEAEIEKARAVVVPLRHPYEVAKSWKRHGRDLEELARQWRLLVDVVDKANPCYLPIDSVNYRWTFLEIMSATLGHKLWTDWRVVRQDHGPPAEVTLDAHELKLVGELAERLAPLMCRFWP